MFDLTLVQALYDLQHDPTATPEEREEAKQKIAQISDTVVEEYLSSLVHETNDGFGRRQGDRRFESYDVLWARNFVWKAQSSARTAGKRPTRLRKIESGTFCTTDNTRGEANTETVVTFASRTTGGTRIARSLVPPSERADWHQPFKGAVWRGPCCLAFDNDPNS